MTEKYEKEWIRIIPIQDVCREPASIRLGLVKEGGEIQVGALVETPTGITYRLLKATEKSDELLSKCLKRNPDYMIDLTEFLTYGRAFDIVLGAMPTSALNAELELRRNEKYKD